MKRSLKRYMSILLTVSMVFALAPSVVLGAEGGATTTLTQVGGTLDFENGMDSGTVTGAPANSGPGSITVADLDSNKVLRVQPPSTGGASYWWTLPLNEGDYDLTDYDQVEVSFDWWADITRPGANSLDVRLNDGTDQVLTLRSNGGGTSVNSPATISYYAGNMASTNAPAVGTATTALTGVPRLTKLNATISFDLRLQLASVSVTDGASRSYSSPQPVAIASDKLTSLSVGASRAGGQNWARFNPVDGVEWIEDAYGMRVDNIVIKAASTGLENPDISPTEVTISPSAANLEYGEGSLADRHTATFSAIVLPINATDRNFTWKIADNTIASIVVNEDNTVTVTGVSAGETTLQAVSNMDNTIVGSVPITVAYIPPIAEPTPDFAHLLDEGYTKVFGSNFAGSDEVPLWIFAGGGYHSLTREEIPKTNNYFRFDASGSGNRGSSGNLPSAAFGSKVYVHFDWKVPAVVTERNTFNVSFEDGTNTLLSLRTGTFSGQRTIGAFAGALPGPTGEDPTYFWSSDRYQAFTYNAVETWYTVGVEFDFESMVATVSLVPRDDAAATPSVLEIPFSGSKIRSFVLTGERAATHNLNVVDNGIDNLYFFTTPLSADTVTEVLPYEFLPELPATADNNMWQSWTKTVYIGDVKSENDLELPETIEVKVADGSTQSVAVEWNVTEVPWSKEAAALAYDPNKQGVFSYVGTIINNPGVAVNRMEIQPKLYIENRHKTKLTNYPYSMEKLDRGVAAVPVADGQGILVTWRLLATEYNKGLTFNVYRNGEQVNTEPIVTLNYIDADGVAGDSYVVETIPTSARSKSVTAWENNFIDIPLQRPAERVNPAYVNDKDKAANEEKISYTANDMSVADIDGDGQYEILVKWYPSQAQDPGQGARHTGETIFDLYTLEGKLLWRINLGINIVSSAHHSAFNFYDLDQDGRAEFSVKTADGTRVYLPKQDGTIDDVEDTPAWVIGDRNAIWVGGLKNPAKGDALNEWALGRVAEGPELLTVFNGRTGAPIDTVPYFAPYAINKGNWGDDDNNRSDRFNGAVAYMPKNGVRGAAPYPTVVEVRGHYGPHFVGAYQLINGKLKLIWDFKLAEWGAGNNQGNHNLKVADVDFDGYSEVVLGAITLDQDGTIVYSSNGTRGTARAGHGDALHVAAMVPDSDEIYVFSPHESGPPNNVTLVRGSTGAPVWTYSANVGDVGRGVAANVTPLPGYEVWAIQTPMYNVVSGEIVTTDVGGIGFTSKAPVNFVLYWDGDLLSEFFDGPNNDDPEITDGPSITKFNYDVETKESELTTLQVLTGAYSNNNTKANPGLIADIFGDWRDEVLVRTSDNKSLRIYTTDIPTEHVIYTLMHDPQYRLAVNSQNAMYNQPAHLGFYLGEDIADKVQEMQLPVPNLYYGKPAPSGGILAPPGIEIEDELEPDTEEPTPTPQKPLLNSSIASAEQLKANLQQALQDNEPKSFADVSDTHWAAKAIQYASQLQIVEGFPNGDFQGAKQVTRAEFAAMIVRSLGIETTGKGGSFSDTDGHWADALIGALHDAGVVNGTGNGAFNPDQEITRAEMSAILARVLNMSEASGASAFSDINGHWAADHIEQLNQAGIVNGVGTGKFAPNATATREQSAAIIVRMLNIVLELELDL